MAAIAVAAILLIFGNLADLRKPLAHLFLIEQEEKSNIATLFSPRRVLSISPGRSGSGYQSLPGDNGLFLPSASSFFACLLANLI